MHQEILLISGQKEESQQPQNMFSLSLKICRKIAVHFEYSLSIQVCFKTLGHMQGMKGSKQYLDINKHKKIILYAIHSCGLTLHSESCITHTMCRINVNCCTCKWYCCSRNARLISVILPSNLF